jgi:hypothetical protein
MGATRPVEAFCASDAIFPWQWSERHSRLIYCNSIAKENLIIFLAVFKSFHIRICNRSENTPIYFTEITYNSPVLWWTLRQKRRTLHRIINIIIISGVRLSPLGTAATTGLLYQSQMIDDGDCGTIGGMKIGRGNRSARRKPAPVSLCIPQILRDLTRVRTRAAAVAS